MAACLITPISTVIITITVVIIRHTVFVSTLKFSWQTFRIFCKIQRNKIKTLNVKISEDIF